MKRKQVPLCELRADSLITAQERRYGTGASHSDAERKRLGRCWVSFSPVKSVVTGLCSSSTQVACLFMDKHSWGRVARLVRLTLIEGVSTCQSESTLRRQFAQCFSRKHGKCIYFLIKALLWAIQESELVSIVVKTLGENIFMRCWCSRNSTLSSERRNPTHCLYS